MKRRTTASLIFQPARYVAAKVSRAPSPGKESKPSASIFTACHVQNIVFLLFTFCLLLGGYDLESTKLLVETAPQSALPHAKYRPIVRYELPDTDVGSWEYNERVTSRIVKEQSSAPKYVNRYVGAGAWIKPKPGASRDLLLNAKGQAWVPYDCAGEDWCKNGVKRMDKSFACSEMARLGFTGLLVLGKSHERHLFQALTMIFSGDYDSGSLRDSAAAGELKDCSGNMQYRDSCKKSIAKTKTTCNLQLSMKMREAYSVNMVEYGLNATVRLASKPSDLVIAGVGLHENMLAPRKISKGYFRGLLDGLRSRKANCTFVWFSTPAIQSLRHENYDRKDTSDVLYKYNRAVEEACKLENIDFISSYLLTLGQESYDGVHYEQRINVLRATLFLWQLFRDNGVRPLLRERKA